MKILGVIPARGGSKSIPRKNLSDVHGRPLLSFIVEAAKNTRTLDRVILTTEDEEIAAVGRKWGAETPFMRPAELAEDEVGLVPVAQHAMRAMDEFGYPSDIVVSIQVTSPFIEAKDIDRVVDKLLETDADSAASVEPIAHEHPYWVKKLEGDRLRPFNEYTNESFLQRQELPPAHIFDGGVFARKRKLLENWSGNDFCMGEDVRAVVFGGKKSLHIDDPIQLEMVRVLIQSDS